jgi:molecular chaperone GrpE
MSASEEESHGPVIRDRRRIDPVTGEPRRTAAADGSGAGDTSRQGQARPGRHSASRPGSLHAEATAAGPASGPSGAAPAAAQDGTGDGEAGDRGHADSDLAVKLAERTADLQRVQAEYANYRKRVDRDRTAVRELAVAGVLAELLPVLDDIGRAREHEELKGGFKAVADALESAAGKLGLTAFGTAGEPFDPNIHEALMHSYSADVTEPTCVQVLQPGYKVGERILRPARVAVAEPTDPAGARPGGDADEPAEASSGQAEGKEGNDEDQAPANDG